LCAIGDQLRSDDTPFPNFHATPSRRHLTVGVNSDGYVGQVSIIGEYSVESSSNPEPSSPKAETLLRGHRDSKRRPEHRSKG
ncbi:hypothetical protein AVEN_162093-1, partial [Araneus ventricosus]